MSSDRRPQSSQTACATSASSFHAPAASPLCHAQPQQPVESVPRFCSLFFAASNKRNWRRANVRRKVCTYLVGRYICTRRPACFCGMPDNTFTLFSDVVEKARPFCKPIRRAAPAKRQLAILFRRPQRCSRYRSLRKEIARVDRGER